ncbi:hypothetical protein ACFLQ1_02295, partial [Candidatus Auribacterota bacterium]
MSRIISIFLGFSLLLQSAPSFALAPKSSVDELKKALPWKTMIRFKSDTLPNDEAKIKYWQNHYDARLYMLSFIRASEVSKMSLDNFKEFLKTAHRYAAIGKNGDRGYKLRPRRFDKKEREMETGGEFRSHLPRTAETDTIDRYHVPVINAAKSIEEKYGLHDLFIDNWTREGQIVL